MSASTAYTERDGSEIVQYDDFAVEYRDASHMYWLMQDDRRWNVPSVTGIIKVLAKDHLLPWRERMGAEGVARIVRQLQDAAHFGVDRGDDARTVLESLLADLDEITLTPEDAWQHVEQHKLGARARRDAGQSRGTLIHNMQESYVRTGSPPVLGDFDPEHRGYVQAYCNWLLFAQPEPFACEKRVGSVRHGYAGTLDLHAAGTYRSWAADGRSWVPVRAHALWDLKTSRGGGVWPEHGFQLVGYEVAHEECGGDPVDALVVVGLSEDGRYTDRVVRLATLDWLNVLGAYRSMQRAKQWANEARDAA